MNSFVTLITFSFTLYVSYAWISMSSGDMDGVTYAGGTVYNADTMCPNNVNQWYMCDGRNSGDIYLDADKVSSFCRGHTGNYQQYGFGHGVIAAQKCGECAQIRVPRTDGSYNYMTVMMVDQTTRSMEVGTTEIAYLVQDTKWVVGDRADFDYRIVDDYDCFASFDGDSATSSPTTTTSTSSTSSTSRTLPGGGCGVSSNWGSMKINPYFGSSPSSMYVMVHNAPVTISSFEIRGADQNNNEFQSCVKQNANAFQCSISGGPLTEPASVKLNDGAYYGIDIIESMSGSTEMYPLTSCMEATTTTTTTTNRVTTTTETTTTARASKTTTSSTSTTRVIGNGKRCLITNLEGSSSWWYTVSVSDCTDGVVIDAVYLKGRGQSNWDQGTYYSWSGGYYVFDNSANTPYNGPLSFKIVSSSGESITSNNIIADTTPDISGRMDSSFSAAYSITDNEDGDGLDWTVIKVIFGITVCCVVFIGCIGGGIYCWRQKKRGNAYFVASQNNDKHDSVKVEVEAQFGEDAQNMITQTND